MDARSLVYELTHPLLALLRSNRLLIRCLFGVKVPRDVQVSYDPTTIALSHAVLDSVTEDDKSFFEMGIGQAALVSLSLAIRQGVPVSGADCSRPRVESSRRVAETNNVTAAFVESDLFSAVPADERFDLIFFNVPYVPSAQGQQLQLTRRLGVDGDQVWDGGEDGTEVLSKFLDACKQHLTPQGRVLFGVQNLFVPDERVCEVLDEAGYMLQKRFRKRFVPSCCYVVRPETR